MSITPLLNADIERVELELLPEPQVECPVVHRFAPGVYAREIFMPAGTAVIGHEHRTEHFNIVLTGSARVQIEGQWHAISAGTVFVSKPGVRKVLHILEDMRWLTIHPTDETDLTKLEELCIVKSPSYLAHHSAPALPKGDTL